MSPTIVPFLGVLLCLAAANAHIAAFAPGMYCRDGNIRGVVNKNSNAPCHPLYNLTQKDWWFQAHTGCDQFPPPPGEFLELPAGGEFMVQLADNQRFTLQTNNGESATEWGDGNHHPMDYHNPHCITSPNMHTQNQSMAAGSAFAISYHSDISEVTPDNLVVFTVAYHTPWMLNTTYHVPARMPPCPKGGCTCAWLWIPNGCGQPNMYQQGFKCTVTNSISNTPVARGRPAVWCEDNKELCVKGAKQGLYWNQFDGNNIQVEGYDLAGSHKSPAYNDKCGFADGAQNDIFEDSSATSVADSPATSIADSPVTPTVKSPVTSVAKPPATSTSKPQATSASKSETCKPSSSPNTKKRRLVDDDDGDDDGAILKTSDEVLGQGISSHRRTIHPFGRSRKGLSW